MFINVDMNVALVLVVTQTRVGIETVFWPTY